MSEPKGTEYAITDDGAHIAFQVLGHGPPDLLVIMSSAFPIEDQMEGRESARFLRRLASFSRVIRLDRRGIAMSDPVRSFDEHIYERWIDDVLAVLDTVKSSQHRLTHAERRKAEDRRSALSDFADDDADLLHAATSEVADERASQPVRQLLLDAAQLTQLGA